MTFDNVVEAVWLHAREHVGTYVSERVALELFHSSLYKSLGGAGAAVPRMYSDSSLLHWFAGRGLLIEVALAPPGGGAAEVRRSGFSRAPHYYVAEKVVWDALATAARLGGIDDLPR